MTWIRASRRLQAVQREPGCVTRVTGIYVVAAPSLRLLKVGFSSHMRERLRVLAKHFDGDLLLLKTIRGATTQHEHEMHHELDRWRVADPPMSSWRRDRRKPRTLPASMLSGQREWYRDCEGMRAALDRAALKRQLAYGDPLIALATPVQMTLAGTTAWLVGGVA